VIGRRRRRGGGLCARGTRRRCSAEDFTAAEEGAVRWSHDKIVHDKNLLFPYDIVKI